MNPNGFGLGAHGDGHNDQDDNSPNSSRGNPSSSRASGTVLTDVSPDLSRAGRLSANPAPSSVETYHPSLFAQQYLLNCRLLEYAVKKANIAGLQVFEVEGYFTTCRHASQTRYLQINVPGVVEFASIIKSEVAFHNAVPLSAGKEQPDYPKFIRFDNLRAAEDALVKLQILYYDVQFMTTHDYALVKYDVVDLSKRYEGQVSVWLNTFGAVTLEDVQAGGPMRSYVYDELVTFGPIRGIHADSWYCNCVRFRIEFESLNDSQRCLKMLGKWLTDPNRLPRSHTPNTILTLNSGYGWRIVKVHAYQPPTDHLVYEAPCTTFPPTQANNTGHAYGYATTHLEPVIAHAQPQTQNRVSIGRVLGGHDVRTTVMLRNIPNRMDWVDLKHLLDSHCFGDYDFIYLRIDFKTCSNVGYAFINFTSPTALIRAIKHIEHARWPGYHSSKRAEISYATIQGKEALVQKFRNSSVMREAPYCRPRTFISWLDVQNGMCHNIHTGKEVPFPDPDNNAKLQRSIDNARNVGLYPPHSSGYTHDTNRNRSMYDRGTPKDQMETAVAATSDLTLTPERSGGSALNLGSLIQHRQASTSFNIGFASASNDRILPNNLGAVYRPASGSNLQQNEDQADEDEDLYPDGYYYYGRRQ